MYNTFRMQAGRVIIEGNNIFYHTLEAVYIM